MSSRHRPADSHRWCIQPDRKQGREPHGQRPGFHV